MSTTEKSHLEAVIEALLKKEKLDPVVEKIHDEAMKIRAKFETEVSLEALVSARNDE